MSVGASEQVTRQQRRAATRAAVWAEWRCERMSNGGIVGPADERGIIPRRVRRSIARTVTGRVLRGEGDRK